MDAIIELNNVRSLFLRSKDTIVTHIVSQRRLYTILNLTRVIQLLIFFEETTVHFLVRLVSKEANPQVFYSI